MKKPHAITTCAFEDSGAIAPKGDYWRAETLYKAADEQGCKVYRFPLKHLNMTLSPFKSTERIWDMAYHVKRCMNADLDIPIIIGPGGDVLDGNHRLVKALAEGRDWVVARRLKELPHPDEQRE